MRSISVLALLVLSPISCISATAITPAPSKTTAVAERGIFSSASLGSCSTVSGLASPQPSGAVCGELATSDGTGYLISYTSGSPYVASLAACGEICLTTSTCTNVYFTQGTACNLHNTITAISNSGSTYRFYDATCFSCTALQTCSVVSGFATPRPPNTTCGVLAVSDGSNIMVEYTSGVYTENAATCGEICLETAGCTNVYFETGAYCILHSGKPTNTADSASPYTFYDLGCFTCQTVIYSSSSSSVSIKQSASTSSTSLSAAPTTTSASTTSTTSSISPTITSTSTAPTTTALWTWTSVQTNPALYNMALTTTFTQSPQCTTGAITEMVYGGPYLWDNSVNPLPTSTVTTCYPPQFYSSVIGTLNNVDLPAFSALVCPYDWDTIPYNASYIACCPNDFGLIAPNYFSNSARPFSAALCTSNIGLSQVYDISSYNSTAYWTVVPATATAGTVVFADAFDGITAHATSSATTSTSSSTHSPTQSSTSSSKSTTATSTLKPSTTTSTSKTSSVACRTVSGLASPTPSGAICGTQADSTAKTGTGVLIDYTAGSPYVASLAACGAICLSTTSCTNVYFVQGANCNLHYGVDSYVLNTNGVNAYSLYDVACFVCR